MAIKWLYGVILGIVILHEQLSTAELVNITSKTVELMEGDEILQLSFPSHI